MNDTARPHISVVSPVYKAEKIIDVLATRLIASIQKITDSFEIILVEDHSPDGSWERIQSIANSDSRVVGLKLSRNFGQHYAITAGLEVTKGEWVVVMDCDLQDQPEEIIKLYEKAKEGYDIVFAKRSERKDTFLKRWFSKLFYGVLSYLTDLEQDATVANFGIYNRKVINSIGSMKESIRFFPSMVKWVGFRSTRINVDHSERFEGKTSYNFQRLFNLALDIVLAYSDKPLRLTVKSGFLMSLLAIVFAVITFVRALRGDIEVLGYSSLIISIWFLSGVIIFVLGIVGLYVGKIFEGVKKRPIYVIDERTDSLTQ